MVALLPFLTIALLSSGSNSGSMSLVTDSIKTVLPNVMALCRVCIHLSVVYENLTISSYSSSSEFWAATWPFSHIVPCNCGSIINGHLVHDVITDAFSIDIGSSGRPSFFHWAIWDALVRMVIGVVPSVIGMFLPLIFGIHWFCHRSNLNSAVNGAI